MTTPETAAKLAENANTIPKELSRPRRPRRGRKNWRLRLALVLLSFAVAVGGLGTGAYHLVRWFFPSRTYYTAEQLGITQVQSPRDANANGVDDYTDIVLGARLDAENKPRYDGSFYTEGGYPPDDIGVCTDVVWRALDHAGYSLKDLVDADIAQHPDLYPGLTGGVPDPNIDFRRVRNLKVFLERHCESLTLDLADVEAWQPGDIVVFEGKTWHIGILSDKRNRDGIPWIIHNSGQPHREEDTLKRQALSRDLTGHYRWTGPVTEL